MKQEPENELFHGHKLFKKFLKLVYLCFCSIQTSLFRIRLQNCGNIKIQLHVTDKKNKPTIKRKKFRHGNCPSEDKVIPLCIKNGMNLLMVGIFCFELNILIAVL